MKEKALEKNDFCCTCLGKGLYNLILALVFRLFYVVTSDFRDINQEYFNLKTNFSNTNIIFLTDFFIFIPIF